MAAQKKTKMARSSSLYRPGQTDTYRISRSGIELFMQCPRCFYLDKVRGVKRPPGFPFSLNSAVDALFKNEFDYYRLAGKPHPLFTKYGIKAVPFPHEKLNDWRHNFTGISYQHKHLHIYGAVDDVWNMLDEQDPNGGPCLCIADYKSTSKDAEVDINSPWQDGYKRQADIYTWLFKQNGFYVHDTYYFVYTNGIRTAKEFNDQLKFRTLLLPYHWKHDWIEPTLEKLIETLNSCTIPHREERCEYCTYAHKYSTQV